MGGALQSVWYGVASFLLMAVALVMAWMLLAVVLVAPAHAAETQATSLTIRVDGVMARGGVLRLGLYDRAHYPDDKAEPVASADVPAHPGETVITLKGMPPGVYAIEAYQDINANGKMDQNWVGFPLEPYGFSRDAKPGLAKPRFEAVKFTVAAGENEQTLNLQNTASFFASK